MVWIWCACYCLLVWLLYKRQDLDATNRSEYLLLFLSTAAYCLAVLRSNKSRRISWLRLRVVWVITAGLLLVSLHYLVAFREYYRWTWSPSGLPIPSYTYLSVEQLAELKAAEEAELGSLCPSCPRSTQPGSSPNARIAMVTILGESPGIHAKHRNWLRRYVPLTLSALADYAHRHGHAFFFLNNFLINVSDTRSIFWSKSTAVRHYLDRGYDWVLYTDLDVIITQPEVPLSKWTAGLENYALATTLECTRQEGWDGIIAGFGLWRNCPEARALLAAWQALAATWDGEKTSDNAALRHLITSEPHWQASVALLPTYTFHTYPECFELANPSFSVHFPSYTRKLFLFDWFKQLFPSQAVLLNVFY